MKSTMTSAALAAVLLAACSSSDDEPAPPPALDTPAAIQAYVEGKTWVMQGADIPPFPNGFDEDVAAYNQCYNKVTISVLAGTWNVTSVLGTIDATPDCKHDQPGATLGFDSNTITIGDEVDWGGTPGTIVGNGSCFDVRVAYEGFSQEGRGSFSADGTTMQLELYFAGQAVGSRCADGVVGSGIDSFLGVPVVTQKNATQTYRLQ